MNSNNLKQISEATANDRHALVILDGASVHTQDKIDEFNNFWILKLPPYSPELNPIEQVWQWLRLHCLANRSLKTLTILLSNAVMPGIRSLSVKIG